MRIAYFSETLPPLTDGVTRTLSRLVETLELDNVDFRFYSAFRPGPDVRWHERVHQVPSLPFLLYNEYRFALPAFGGLEPLLDGFRPDLVHTVNPTMLGLYGIRYAQRRGLPVVASYHTDFVSYFPYYGLKGLEPLGWRYLAWFYNQCDATYAPSPSAAGTLREHGIHEVRLWERGIDLARFSPDHRSNTLRDSVGATDGTPILLFVGRLVREKNLAILADACDMLSAWGESFRLVLVGDGPMRAELERRLPYAHFAGFQHGHDLAAWFASSDLFVFPSTTETFGNVILEAFASGLPAVGVPRGGIQDLIRSGHNGLLAEPDSAPAFADAVRRLMRDAGHRKAMAAAAIRTAASYRWTEVNRRMIDEYRRLIASHTIATRAA